MYIVGVDGGGTKTQTLISDENGNILGASTVGPTYLHSISEAELLKTLEEGLVKARIDSGLKNITASKSCFGISGLDSPYDFEKLMGAVRKISSFDIGPNPIGVNDAEAALRRGTDKKFGIVIVAGTGSNCFGRNRTGETAKVGGLGHVLSDEGGSYYIGLRVLHAASKSFDGRIEKTILENMVCENFGVSDMREMILKVHEKDFGKMQIASLSYVCEKAAAMGDETAHNILVDAARELVLMLETCLKKLSMESDVFDLVCVGGTFRKKDGPARAYFEQKVSELAKKARIVYPVNEPAMGSVFLAIDSLKKTE